MPAKSIFVSGVRFDALGAEQAIEQILAHAHAPNSPARVVTKPYVEFLDRAHRDASTKNMLNQADWSLADGIAIIWAAHYLYNGPRTFWRWITTITQIIFQPNKLLSPLPERVAGITFTLPLLERAADLGLRVYLVGSPLSNTIEQTAAILRQRLRRLDIVGTMHGTLTTSYEANLVIDIQAKKPDLILIGLGFPIQEKLMVSLRGKLNHGVLIGEGGTFDYTEFGGKRRRAPKFMRQSGLEWLWRLILEPKRIHRQLAIPKFLWLIRSAEPE